MSLFIQKTLGGLSKEYYFRQVFFGGLLALPFIIFLAYAPPETSLGMILFVITITVMNTLLYPYARFVYEGVINFIVGNNTLRFRFDTFITTKVITMVLCWGFSLFIAPIGLAYLYFYHSKRMKSDEVT